MAPFDRPYVSNFRYIMIRSYGRCEQQCGRASCTERIAQGNDFELILTVKMETCSEFRAIGNHCGVMAA